MSEPSANIEPVREFIGGETSYFETLADLRLDMEIIDVSIVELLAARAECVRQATLFKRDLSESTAPERQVTNIDNAVWIAGFVGSRLPGFSQIVKAVYEELVPGSVAAQHQVLAQTFLKSEGHRLEPEIWDLGSIPNYRQNIIDRWDSKAA